MELEPCVPITVDIDATPLAFAEIVRHHLDKPISRSQMVQEALWLWSQREVQPAEDRRCDTREMRERPADWLPPSLAEDPNWIERMRGVTLDWMTD